MKLAIPRKAVPYLEVAPLAIILFFFFVVPMAMVLVASFFDYNMTGIIRTFTLSNYIDLLTSRTTLELYLETLKFALIVWAITAIPCGPIGSLWMYTRSWVEPAVPTGRTRPDKTNLSTDGSSPYLAN